MRAESAARLVRGWVSIYTRGLPGEARQDRRDEIDDDLWCQLQESAMADGRDRSPASAISLRLLFGIPADVAWRIEQIRLGQDRAPARRALTMRSPGLGFLAAAGGLCWAIWPIPRAIVGPDWPDGGPLSTLLVFTVLPGIIAIAGAMSGLAARAQDRIPAWTVALAVITAIAGPVSVLGLYGLILVVPIGSALLFWQLARVGAVGTSLTRAHLAAAALWEVPLAVLYAKPTMEDDPAAAVLIFSLAIPYGISWMALGWSLLRGQRVATDGIAGASAG